MRKVWLTIVCITFIAGLSVSLLGHLANYLRDEVYNGDWLIFWFTARAPVPLLYHDLDAFPFAYPPTALFLVKPFALLPVWVSLAVWSIIGLTALCLAARSLAKPWVIAVAVPMPAIWWCLLAGQTGLIVSAFVIAGLRWPALWGVGAILKPQSLIALPFTGEWRRLLITAGVGAAFVLASVIVWGVQPWLDWVAVLDDFQNEVSSRDAIRLNLGLGGWTYWPGAVLGAACAFLIFRRSEDLLERYAALACGSVLISPYTLGYDLAGLSIAAAAMLFDEERSVPRWIAGGWVLTGLFPTAGVIALAAVLVWEHSHSSTKAT